jgi:hypothetical protein
MEKRAADYALFLVKKMAGQKSTLPIILVSQINTL